MSHGTTRRCTYIHDSTEGGNAVHGDVRCHQKDLHCSARCLEQSIDSFSSQLFASLVDWRVVCDVVQLTAW